MRISADGISVIKQFEGCRLRSYRCSAGVLTIGWGHTSASGNPIVFPEMTITQEEADQILAADLRKFEDGVTALVKVDLRQGQFDALVSFAFNCGLSALGKSTLLKRINEGKFDAAPAEFMKWTKAGGNELPGLVRRRRAEARLWRGIDTSEAVNTAQSRSKPDQPLPSKSIIKSKEGNAALVAGGLSALSLAEQVADVSQRVSGIHATFSGIFSNQTAVVLLIVCLAAAGIWIWRKQRLDEEGA